MSGQILKTFHSAAKISDYWYFINAKFSLKQVALLSQRGRAMLRVCQ